MAAFTKKARLRAMVLSIKFSFIALRIPFSSRFIFLVCTKAEWRYKLWGITVAPMIPTAIYKAALLGMLGMNPLTTSLIWGFAIMISVKKEIPMIAIRQMINASIFLIPRR